MILRYPPQQQTNSSSCSLFSSQYDSPFPIMNNNTNNDTSNFRLSFIHHSTEIENENTNSLMNDEPPCTPCSTWLSLTSLHQLSFNSNNNLNPNTSDLTSLSSTSCTISNNSNNIESQQLMPPPSFQFSINPPPASIPSSNNVSAKDLFEEEFLLKCNKYRKVNEATRSVSSLTPCSASSAKSLDSNEKSSQDVVEPPRNNSPTNDGINAATATIVSKVLSNVLSKSSELKQKKIQKRSTFKRQDVPRLVIPSDQASAIFVKHCSLQNGKKQ